MSDLATWLLVQYDVDEQRAEDLHDRRTCDMYSYDPKCCDCDYPDELRDDLAAKRAIVHVANNDDTALEWILRLLALPYADCEGYDPAWRIGS